MHNLFRIASIILLLCISAGLSLGQSSENLELVGRWAHGPCNSFAVRGDTVFVGNGAVLQGIDISTAAIPSLVGEITLPNIIQFVALSGNYACIIDDRYFLRIINISNPSFPVEEGSFQTYENITDMAVKDGYAYVVDFYNGLRIIDISNPSNPYEIGYHNTPDFPRGLSLGDNYAYLASTGSGLRIINVSNPSGPYEEGYYDTPGSAQDVEVRNNLAYVADEFSGLRIINVTNASNPTEEGYHTTPGYAYSKVTVAGNCAYVRDSSGMRIINISDPANPTYKSYYYTTHYIMDISANDNYAFYAESASGLHILRVTPYSPSKVSDYRSPGTALDVAIQGDFAYVADAGSGLRVIDVTDPSSPTEQGYYIVPDESCQKVSVSGNYAYILAGGMRIINIADPSNPYEQGSYATQESFNDITVNGNYVYLADGNSGMRIVNVSDPSNPSEESVFNISGGGSYIAVSSSYAYVLGMGVHIINISNPSSPNEVSSVDTYGVGLDVQENYLYILKTGSVDIINISNPANPVGESVYTMPEGGWGYDIAISGNYAHVANAQAGLYIINVSDPSNPTEAGYYENIQHAFAVAVEGDYSYVIDWDVGIYIIYYNTGFQPIEEGYYFTPGHCYDIELRENYAYVGASAGLSIIDLSNPSSPTEVGNFRFRSYWGIRAVKLRENYAYVAAGDSGLYIIDISNPVNPVRVGYFNPPSGVYESLSLGENHAYVASGNGLRIINISNPYAPSEVGYYDLAGAAQDVVVGGIYAYLATGSNGLRVINISNPSNPDEVGFYDTQGYATGVALSGNYAYVADYQSGLRVIDISNASNPDEVGFYDSPGYAADVKIWGDYAYLADGDVNAGLRIINISNPANPILEGYFDTSDYGNAADIHNSYIYLSANKEGIYIFRETSPPSAPENLIADGTSPSPWKNLPQFQIHWTNPSDMSGIANLKYKIGSIPTSNNDFNGMAAGKPPQNITISAEGLNTVYTWLVDSAGNENYNNNSNVILRYDVSISTASNFSESHGLSNNVWQNSIDYPNFNWSAPTDLSGIEKYYVYFGTNPNGTIAIDSTVNTSFNTSATQGVNYLRVQAKDNAGNIGDWVTGFIFRFDNTPPTPPNLATEQNGTISDSWQNNIATPIFNWSGAGDNISGIANYWLYFDTLANGSPEIEIASATFNAPLSINGTYYLRISSEDLAGNLSNIANLFVFRHDDQEPVNPSHETFIDITGQSQNNIWQNDSNDPNFIWNPGQDALSGVHGYYYYWGEEPYGTDLNQENYLTTTNYNPTPVDTGIHYFRIITKDNVEKFASSWTTGYIFKFDNISPQGTRALSADTSASETFVVTWSGDNDSGGAGVAGYTVRAKEGEGGWEIWLADTSSTSEMYHGNHGITYYFEATATDSAGNEEAYTGIPECSTVVDTFAVDNEAPDSPGLLTAGNGNPSPWQNTPGFEINWINPLDMTDIAKAYYKLDSVPTHNTDTTGSLSPSPPDTITATREGGQDLYLWLVDGRGNVNYLNTALVKLRFDQTKPQGSIASSPDTSSSQSFTVSWSNGSDGGGSGLSQHYYIQVRDDSSEWVAWLSDYQGQSAEFDSAKQGFTYCFEAAARDSAGNIEDFTHIAESSTYVKPRLSINIAQLANEQSDSVLIEYKIYNYNNHETQLRCEYSVDLGESFYLATVAGDTIGIGPQDYVGALVWLSSLDLPGVDIDSVIFKITPYDQESVGFPFSSDAFHLDNNESPSILITPLPGEHKDDIEIYFQLFDAENDILSIQCEYYDPNILDWKSATVEGESSSIIIYNSQIIWKSSIDLPQVVGNYGFKIIPFDKDAGKCDSIILLIDQIGAPVVTSLSNFYEEKNDSVVINYVLDDDEGDQIDLICRYSANSGQTWSAATTFGQVNNILPADYTGFVIWLSEIDLPGIDKKTIRFRIVPKDEHEGIGKETDDFHLDNNRPPLIQNIGNILSPSSGIIKIPVNISDTENDTIEVLGEYKHSGATWEWMQFVDTLQFVSPNYEDTLKWNSINQLGFGEFESIQLKLFPVDNDQGDSLVSSKFEIKNYAGDYTGDIGINYDDCIIFSAAWYGQQLEKEIGPAIGEPPLLIPQPDGKIDFEDLMVLVQQWNWSNDHSQLEKSLARIDYSELKSRTFMPITNKENGTVEYVLQKDELLEKDTIPKKTVNEHLISLEQSLYDQWSNEFADKITIKLDTIATVLGYHYKLHYDSKNLEIENVVSYLLEGYNGFTFMAKDKKKGEMNIGTFVLEEKLKSDSWCDGLSQIKLSFKKDGEIPISIDCNIYNQYGKVIAGGTVQIALSGHIALPKSYALYQNFPNPFNPSTTIRYQLPVPGKVKLEVYNILGQRVVILIDDKQEAGFYSKIWDVSKNSNPLASGLYITRLYVHGEDGSRYSKSIKVLVIK